MGDAVSGRRLPELLAALLLASLALSGCGGGEAVENSELRGRSASEASSASPAAAPDVPDGAPLVAVLGDSIAAGLGVADEAAFPAVLQRKLADEGLPFRLVNAGVSGETSAGGLRRLDHVLAQEPDVLVLELGGNDGLRGQAIDEVEERLTTIVRRAQEAGVQVLLLGVRLPPSLGPDYARRFELMYADIAEATACSYHPFFMEGVGGLAARMQDDGVHPNRAGHERIAENVAEPLAELLREFESR